MKRTLSPERRGRRTFVRETSNGEPGVPTPASPGSMVILLSDGKGAGSIDRPIIKIE